MLDYFDRVAASRIDSSEDGSPVWDRDTREWHYQW
jgi:hypothetical protein